MVVLLAVTARPLSEQIPFVLTAIQNLGIVVKQGSRLDRLARVFLTDDGSWTSFVPFADQERFELALESLREFQMFEFILNPWEFGPEPIALGKLRAALKDHALQYAQTTSPTKGRDTQVELFIATAFRRSGAGADFVTPLPGKKSPDIRTRACNRYFYIEAKRVKSRERVVEAVEDAVAQVNATGCPGAAYVDVTMAFNEKNLRANEHLPVDQVQPVFRRWLQGQFEPLRAKVDMVMARSRLTSIFFQYHLLIPVAGEVALRSTILVYPERVSGRYEREDREIRRTLEQRMPRQPA